MSRRAEARLAHPSAVDSACAGPPRRRLRLHDAQRRWCRLSGRRRTFGILGLSELKGERRFCGSPDSPPFFPADCRRHSLPEPAGFASRRQSAAAQPAPGRDGARSALAREGRMLPHGADNLLCRASARRLRQRRCQRRYRRPAMPRRQKAAATSRVSAEVASEASASCSHARAVFQQTHYLHTRAQQMRQ